MRSNSHEWLGKELKRGAESFGEETQYGRGVCVYVCVCMRVCVCMYVHACVCMYVCMCVCVCVHLCWCSAKALKTEMIRGASVTLLMFEWHLLFIIDHFHVSMVSSFVPSQGLHVI